MVQQAGGRHVTMVRIGEIKLDRTLQAREAFSPDAAREYGGRYKQKLPMPPVVLFSDQRGVYWPGDGWHRIKGCQMVGIKMIEAEIRQGGRREALLYAVGANETHGVRRTPEDKRRAVRILVEDPEWGEWTTSEIARRCGVGPHLVGEVRDDVAQERRIFARAKIAAHLEEEYEQPRKFKRNGATHTMNTAKIGRSRITLGADAPQESPEENPDEWVEELRAPVERAVAKLRKEGLANGFAEAEVQAWLDAGMPFLLHRRRVKKDRKKKTAKNRPNR